MAKNRKFESSRALTVPVPAGTKSGDPVVYGQRPGVALEDRDAAGNASVDFGGVYELSVKGVDQSANSAVVAGDLLYLVAGDTPKLSKKNTGVRYGYAHAAVGSGSTAAIDVIVGY